MCCVVICGSELVVVYSGDLWSVCSDAWSECLADKRQMRATHAKVKGRRASSRRSCGARERSDWGVREGRVPTRPWVRQASELVEQELDLPRICATRGANPAKYQRSPTKSQTKKGVTEVTPNVSRTDLQNEGHVPSGVLLRADNSPPAPSAPAGGATCAGFAWVGLRRSPAD